jgi:hypothetical protein
VMPAVSGFWRVVGIGMVLPHHAFADAVLERLHALLDGAEPTARELARLETLLREVRRGEPNRSAESGLPAIRLAVSRPTRGSRSLDSTLTSSGRGRGQRLRAARRRRPTGLRSQAPSHAGASIAVSPHLGRPVRRYAGGR